MPAAPGGPRRRRARPLRPIYSNSSVVRRDPALWPLTDIFALPRWLPWANIFSMGDVLIGVGMVVLVIVRAMTPARRGRGADAERTEPAGPVGPGGAPEH